jgi:prefoldin subunit 5
MEDIERQIKEIKAQISYWNERVFDAGPQNMDMLNTTITSLEYVLYNLEKIKASYEQNPPRH